MKPKTKILGIPAIVAVICGFGLTATAAPPDMDNVPLTLTGCVVAGEAKGSFLLTNVVIGGTTMAPVHAYYRFNSTDGLQDHVGRRVEVTGKADLDDVDKGELLVKVDDKGKAFSEITSERRTVKVDRNVWFRSMGPMEMTKEMATYKFQVDSVKRAEGNCTSSAAAR